MGWCFSFELVCYLVCRVFGESVNSIHWLQALLVLMPGVGECLGGNMSTVDWIFTTCLDCPFPAVVPLGLAPILPFTHLNSALGKMYKALLPS